jgi:hypothetical protein
MTLSNSFDSIPEVEDYLTMMVHFIPCNKSIIGERITKLFFDHVFRYDGFSKYIISYRGPQLASKF